MPITSGTCCLMLEAITWFFFSNCSTVMRAKPWDIFCAFRALYSCNKCVNGWIFWSFLWVKRCDLGGLTTKSTTTFSSPQYSILALSSGSIILASLLGFWWSFHKKFWKLNFSNSCKLHQSCLTESNAENLLSRIKLPLWTTRINVQTSQNNHICCSVLFCSHQIYCMLHFFSPILYFSTPLLLPSKEPIPPLLLACHPFLSFSCIGNAIFKGDSPFPPPSQPPPC